MLDLAQARVVGGQAAPEELAVSHDDHQQVVEVVRDAAGQPAHRLHLLRLAELLLHAPSLRLGPALFRDVEEHHRQEAGRGPERVDLVDALHAVVPVGDLGVPGTALGAQAAVAVGRLGAGEPGKGVLDGPPDERSHVDPQDPVAVGVRAREDEPAVRLEAIEQNGHRGRLDDGAEARFGLAQPFLDGPALEHLGAQPRDGPAQLRRRVEGHAHHVQQAGQDHAQGHPRSRRRGAGHPAPAVGDGDEDAGDGHQHARHHGSPAPEEEGGGHGNHRVGAGRRGPEPAEEPDRRGHEEPQAGDEPEGRHARQARPRGEGRAEQRHQEAGREDVSALVHGAPRHQGEGQGDARAEGEHEAEQSRPAGLGGLLLGRRRHQAVGEGRAPGPSPACGTILRRHRLHASLFHTGLWRRCGLAADHLWETRRPAVQRLRIPAERGRETRGKAVEKRGSDCDGPVDRLWTRTLLGDGEAHRLRLDAARVLEHDGVGPRRRGLVQLEEHGHQAGR